MITIGFNGEEVVLVACGRYHTVVATGKLILREVSALILIEVNLALIMP